MLRHKKNQATPQELYRARKEREEQEKEARLPPGLVNHGNTCFMNSTLQGLMATELLHHLVDFEPVAPSAGPSVVAHRSPQLTNGHGTAGEFERPREDGMPLGDVFVETMRKAWGMQEARTREPMSPKEILHGIGKKYDQYLDFRQQDAHEFLRHMLDAMRMEELDVIKRRQPPPSKGKRSRRRRQARRDPGPASGDPSEAQEPASPTEEVPEEERLASFVDMLFGGMLASILVCEKCKKVSVTHEEFNDLSLSIKPEDYVKGRKRDRLRNLARKLKFPLPGEDSKRQRSSSVPPPSPMRKSVESATAAGDEQEEPPVHEGPRRVSFDHVTEAEAEARDEVRQIASDADRGVVDASAVDDEDDGEIVEEEDAVEDLKPRAEAERGRLPDEGEQDKAEGDDSERGKESKQEKERAVNGWEKLGRRISVSMRMGRLQELARSPSHSVERGRRSESQDGPRFIPRKDSKPTRASLVPQRRGIDSGTDAYDSDAAIKRVGSVSPVPAAIPTPVTVATPPPGTPRISPPLPPPAPVQMPSFMRTPSTGHFPHRRSGSPKPPKLSKDETAYLRRILADVNPSPANPFSMLQQAISATHHGVGPSSHAAHQLWARMGNLPGVAECLRMFTAVEVLDGENMVGCHRCWKIAHAQSKAKNREESPIGDVTADSESEDSEEKTESKPPDAAPQPDGGGEGEESPSSSSSEQSLGRASPASASEVSVQMSSSFELVNDRSSVSTAPSSLDATLVHISEQGGEPNGSPGTYGGLPIPSISTTAPESPIDRIRAPDPRLQVEDDRAPTSEGVPSSAESLLTPKARRPPRRKNTAFDESSESSDESDASGTYSDTSASAYSDASQMASPTLSPRTSNGDLRSTATPSPDLGADGDPQKAAKVPRAKQVIKRRMYKRYLIATPPPVLVVHLKRFQQVGKPHAVSFSGGFKKLDDFVAFPEELDLAPFLAPRKEDFGLGKHKGAPPELNGAPKAPERCMYRLYAVVVHIGNMLGGHYIAYTALPQHPAAQKAETPQLEVKPADADMTNSAPVTPSSPNPDQGEKSTKPKRQWAYISDTVVRLTTIEEVLKAKAYICMYERI